MTASKDSPRPAQSGDCVRGEIATSAHRLALSAGLMRATLAAASRMARHDHRLRSEQAAGESISLHSAGEVRHCRRADHLPLRGFRHCRLIRPLVGRASRRSAWDGSPMSRRRQRPIASRGPEHGRPRIAKADLVRTFSFVHRCGTTRCLTPPRTTRRSGEGLAVAARLHRRGANPLLDSGGTHSRAQDSQAKTASRGAVAAPDGR